MKQLDNPKAATLSNEVDSDATARLVFTLAFPGGHLPPVVLTALRGARRREGLQRAAQVPHVSGILKHVFEIGRWFSSDLVLKASSLAIHQEWTDMSSGYAPTLNATSGVQPSQSARRMRITAELRSSCLASVSLGT